MTWYPGCTVDTCHPMLPCEECADKFTVGRMQAKGYLVIPPGDTSPVAELVSAAVRYESVLSGVDAERAEETLNACITAAYDDPAVRAWVERGRK